MGLVRAAYSAGKPAYGVGPGNAPCIHRAYARTCRKAVRDIVTGKTFDNGVLCSSRELRRRRRGRRRRGEARVRRRRARYFLSPAGDRRARDALLGHAAAAAESGARRQVRDGHRAEQAGITVPADTRVLIAELEGRRPRLPAVDREALPGPFLLRRRATGAKAASAASRSCATAAWATRCRSTRGTIRSSSSSA